MDEIKVMQKVVLICDGCNRGDDDGIVVTPYRIDRGCEMDPSGNGYNTNWEYVDWCNDCYSTNAMTIGKSKIQRV